MKKILILLLFIFATPLFSYRGGLFIGTKLEIIDYMIFAGLVVVGFFLMITSFKVRKDDSSTNIINEENNDNLKKTYRMIKLQFGVHVAIDNIKYIIKDLINDMSEEDKGSLKIALSKTATLLLENRDYIKYGFIKNSPKTDDLMGVQFFFDEEVIIEDKKIKHNSKKNPNKKTEMKEIFENIALLDEIKEYIIITITTVLENVKLSLEDEYSKNEYLKALQKLSRVPTNRVVNVEIQFSPEKDGYVITDNDIFLAYTNLIKL